MTKIDTLVDKLKEIEQITNEKWLSSLDERKKQELLFHDRDRDKDLIKTLDTDTYEKFYGNIKYYEATGPSKNYINQWIEKESKGKVFLDYACGNGEYALKAAKAGAKLSIGIDISSISVQNAREEAKKQNLENNTYFVQADAENTMLPDKSVDAILCSGMLHHLDLSYAFYELRRILAPKGKILAAEALDYNPFIKLYRYLTPSMRTEWEKAHILSLKDIRFAKRFFDISDIKYWHITSILGPHLKLLLPLFHLIDKGLTKIPLVRLMAWMFTFELVPHKTNK